MTHRRPRAGRSDAPRRSVTGSAGCSTWCPTCWPGPASWSPRRPPTSGVSERQLREDLELLWVCGLPGYGPGDLIDMALDGDRVTISHDAGIDRPLRLTQDEALALVVALRMLAETPGTGTRDAIERALAKIENAAGDLADAPVAVRLPANAERLDRAPGRGRGRARAAPDVLHGGPRRDHRAGGRPDAGADGGRPRRTWRRGAAGPRRPGCSGWTGSTRSPSWTSRPARPSRRCPHDVSDGVFRPGRRAAAGHPAGGPAAGRWITEYYPVEEVRRRRRRVGGDMRVTDLGWAQRLLLGLGPDVTVVGPPELVDRIRAQATAALRPVRHPGPVGPTR